MNGEPELLMTAGIPGPPLYTEKTQKAPTSVPPAGQTTVSQGQSAVTGRFEVYRNGYRIATAKTASHAAEIAAHAALNWPNTYQPPIVTSFEPPFGF
jgi:hypothetical protein